MKARWILFIASATLFSAGCKKKPPAPPPPPVVEVVETDTLPSVTGSVAFDIRGDRVSLWTGESSIWSVPFDERIAPLLSNPNIRKITYDLKDAMLKAQPKSGVKETAVVGMKETASLYKGPDNPNDKPLRVGKKNMDETLALLVEYGGLDKATAGKADDYYTNAYLP